MGHQRLVRSLPRIVSMSGTRPLVHAVTALRTMCGVAALLGLFAMHGLAAHGTAHQRHTSEPVVVASAEHGDASVTVHPASEESRVSSGAGDRAPDPGLLGLAGMCLAVLLIGVVVAVVLGRGIAVHGAHGRSSLRAGVRPSRARRERDPPCLFALSIQRC